MTEEDIIQIQVVHWIKSNTTLPVIGIANQRACSPREGAKLKRMGVKAGCSDLFIPRPSSIYHGLWIELKTAKGKPSTHQIAFVKEMQYEGYEAVFAYGFEEAIAIIKEFYAF
jgi:hypothetical protein